MSPEDLIVKLEREAAEGWPKPWHWQDAEAASLTASNTLSPVQEVQLQTLLDLLASAFDPVPSAA